MELTKTNQKRFITTVAAAIMALLPAVSSADDLLDLMADEMNRELAVLKKQDTPPYYLSYTITDVEELAVYASFGALTESDRSTSRMLTVDVRVGSYELDSTHELRDQSDYGSDDYMLTALDDNPAAIRTAIWEETNIEGWANYDATDLSGRDDGIEEALEMLAKEIIDKTVSGW